MCGWGKNVGYWGDIEKLNSFIYLMVLEDFFFKRFFYIK